MSVYFETNAGVSWVNSEEMHKLFYSKIIKFEASLRKQPLNKSPLGI